MARNTVEAPTPVLEEEYSYYDEEEAAEEEEGEWEYEYYSSVGHSKSLADKDGKFEITKPKAP